MMLIIIVSGAVLFLVVLIVLWKCCKKKDGSSPDLSKMRVKAKERVKNMFTTDVFADKLDDILKQTR